jgi:integrase/recombinase XerD
MRAHGIVIAIVRYCCSCTTPEPVLPKPFRSAPPLSVWTGPGRFVFGKGSKERICPLWPETAAALRRIISTGSDDPLFKSAAGKPLSRDGVAYLIQKHARIAAERCPALRKRRITPHVLRHSCACALLQAGVDITVIRDYLGHSSVATTSRYITTNLQMKRDALEAFWKRAGLEANRSRKWRPSPQLLTFLETL